MLRAVHDYFFSLDWLINMIGFWYLCYVRKSWMWKNLCVGWWRTCPVRRMFEGSGCGFFCCVIEEEGLQLHLVKLGLGCFCCLGFGLFADWRRKGFVEVNLLLPLFGLHFGWACFGLLLVFRAWIVCRLKRQKGWTRADLLLSLFAAKSMFLGELVKDKSSVDTRMYSVEFRVWVRSTYVSVFCCFRIISNLC